MDENEALTNQEILKRLKRIEGQIKGIQKMVEDDKLCMDILTQVAAVRAATNKVGIVILEKYYKKSMKELAGLQNPDRTMEELLSTVQKFLGFVE